VFIRGKGNEVTIPFQHEIEELIRKSHNDYRLTKVKHLGVNATYENLKKFNFYWTKMVCDIKKYIADCSDCVMEKWEKPVKHPKIITVDGPLSRLQIDLWEIPKEIRDKSLNKTDRYVLSGQCHFSKYKWAFILPNKQAETVAQPVEIILNTFGGFKEIQFDHGTEFVNSTMTELCNSKGVKIIKGSVRHPQSQGLVERMNGLLSFSVRYAFTKYLSDLAKDKNKSINLDLVLKAFIENENNRVHLITKEVPNHLIVTKDKELIKTVKQRIHVFYSKRNDNIANVSLKKGMKMFIIKKVRADRKKKTLLAEKETLFSKRLKVKIPAEISSTAKLSRNQVNVRVKANTDSHIPPGVYTIKTELLAVASEKAWKIVAKQN